MYGLLFSLPDATTTLAAVGGWSNPISSDLLPIAYISLGVFFGLFIIQWIIGAVSGLFHRH